MPEPSDYERQRAEIARLELRVKKNIDDSHDQLRKSIGEDLRGMEGRLREYIGSVNERAEKANDKAQKAHDLAIIEKGAMKKAQSNTETMKGHWGWVLGASTVSGCVVGLLIKILPDILGKM